MVLMYDSRLRLSSFSWSCRSRPCSRAAFHVCGPVSRSSSAMPSCCRQAQRHLYHRLEGSGAGRSNLQTEA